MFPGPSEDFYQNYLVKPGIFFYRMLALAPHSAFKEFEVNIPEVLVNNDMSNYLIFTDANGMVQR